jgi:hypothetical protein
MYCPPLCHDSCLHFLQTLPSPTAATTPAHGPCPGVAQSSSSSSKLILGAHGIGRITSSTIFEDLPAPPQVGLLTLLRLVKVLHHHEPHDAVAAYTCGAPTLYAAALAEQHCRLRHVFSMTADVTCKLQLYSKPTVVRFPAFLQATILLITCLPSFRSLLSPCHCHLTTVPAGTFTQGGQCIHQQQRQPGPALKRRQQGLQAYPKTARCRHESCTVGPCGRVAGECRAY